ncbi:MAG TPA: YceI family protein [Leptospiraceae bacterium]|nr:YceI family protein [Leptospiraceae bacterium]HMY66316.1 YceI family protein [Leptospiraceae bacterium]HNF14786.1 YceI family protein [Leptospiraceae bacterium]HNF22953.1 YceI family protein [Leptospiraceae bacterium]HNI24954.1 YceI family protein [Leptospiraceae bacterium]
MKIFIIILALFFSSLQAGTSILDKEAEFTAALKVKKVEGKVKNFTVSPFTLKRGKNSEFSITPFSIVIPVKELKTGDPNRDSNMQEALGYPAEKEITLNIQRIQPSETGAYRIFFRMKIKGKEKELESSASVKEESGRIVVSGKFSVFLHDFNIDPPTLLFMTVQDEVFCRYRFSIQAE